MEEEWDLVNSLNSSLNVPEKNTSVELNFNRFANQPEFHIDDEGLPEDYDQQLMDEGVIFCDSPPPPEEEEIYEDEEYSREYEEGIYDDGLYAEGVYDDELYEEGVYDDRQLLQQEGEEEGIYEEDIYEEDLPQEELYEEELYEEELYEEELYEEELYEEEGLTSEEEEIYGDEEEELLQEKELTLEEGDLTLEEEEVDLLQNEEEYIVNDEDLNFTLGDNKLLINNDPITDDVQNNNELEEQRINQFKNIYLSSFFPINNFMNEQENNNTTTRESQVDKNAIWKNTETGSSVPYISPEVSKEEEEENEQQQLPIFTGTFPPFNSSSFSFGSTFKSTLVPEEEISKKLSRLQVDLDSNTSIEDSRGFSPSTRPMKQMRSRQSPKKLELIEKSLPAFAASPKSTPSLSIQTSLITTDIPPSQTTDSENQYEQDPTLIKENLSHCFGFSRQHQGQLTSIYLYLQEHMPDITKWYQLKHLDLSRQHLVRLNDLDTCFPMLETLVISHNELKSISGLPLSLCYLYASHNNLNEIDIYHLSRLQRLDLSHNVITNFENMSQLKSLRNLDVSHNNIKSCQPFQNLTGLIVLSLKSNMIQKLTGFNHGQQERYQLESLDVSFNRIECLDSVDSLSYLRELDATHNDIKCVQLDLPMLKLCKLKLSFNRLKSFDMSFFPDVRTLYLDDNQIERLIGVTCISRLDSFSLRDQGRQKVEYNIQYLRGTRKLYLSGSPFKSMHQMIDFYSLETLELCSAGLEELPTDFSKHVPNLVNLYLSMNRLQEIRPLKRLKYLRRLYLIDNRLLSVNEIISVAKQLKRLLVLDLRQNPMCTNVYPALDTSLIRFSNSQEKISPYITTAHDESWEATDIEFRQNLSDHWKTRREVYRAFMIKQCPNLNELDHLLITSSERTSGDQVIDNFHKSRTSSQKSF